MQRETNHDGIKAGSYNFRIKGYLSKLIKNIYVEKRLHPEISLWPHLHHQHPITGVSFLGFVPFPGEHTLPCMLRGPSWLVMRSLDGNGGLVLALEVHSWTAQGPMHLCVHISLHPSVLAACCCCFARSITPVFKNQAPHFLCGWFWVLANNKDIFTPRAAS